MNTLQLTRHKPHGRGAIHHKSDLSMRPKATVGQSELIKRYRHTVLHEAPSLDPTVNAAWAKELARLTAAFRPDCRDALQEAFVECFPIAD